MKEQTKKTILLIFICVITLAVLVVSLNIHKNRQDDLLSTSKISKYLTEIKYEEISTHVVEQPNAIIYVSNSEEDASIKFEDYFKTVVKKYNLENDVIYINIKDTTIVDPIYQYAPELVFYEDGEISDIIDCMNLKNDKDIVKVLKERSVIGD